MFNLLIHKEKMTVVELVVNHEFSPRDFACHIHAIMWLTFRELSCAISVYFVRFCLSYCKVEVTSFYLV